MGKLMDAILKSNKPISYAQPIDNTTSGTVLPKYTHNWLSQIAIHNGYTPSSNTKKVDGILGALNRRNGQCPCGGNGEQFKCPCKIMRENSICKCGLFETLPEREFKTSTTAKISKQ